MGNPAEDCNSTCAESTCLQDALGLESAELFSWSMRAANLSSAAYHRDIAGFRQQLSRIVQGSMTESWPVIQIEKHAESIVAQTFRAYATRDASEHVVWMIFTGTDEEGDWTNTNLNVSSAPFEFVHTGCPMPHVHEGIFTHYKTLRQGLENAFQNISQPGDQVRITGHSLGGALALLAHSDQQAPWNRRSSAVTFGSPPYLDNGHSHELGENMTCDLRENRTLRFVNQDDIVPQWPEMAGFRHGDASVVPLPCSPPSCSEDLLSCIGVKWFACHSVFQYKLQIQNFERDWGSFAVDPNTDRPSNLCQRQWEDRVPLCPCAGSPYEGRDWDVEYPIDILIETYKKIAPRRRSTPGPTPFEGCDMLDPHRRRRYEGFDLENHRRRRDGPTPSPTPYEGFDWEFHRRRRDGPIPSASPTPSPMLAYSPVQSELLKISQKGVSSEKGHWRKTCIA